MAVSVIGLLTALAVLAGAVWKWLADRNKKTREQELLDAIHKSWNDLDGAIQRKDYYDLSRQSSSVRDNLRILLRKKGYLPPDR